MKGQEHRTGLDVHDAASDEHVLWTTQLPRLAFAAAAPLVLRALELHAGGALPETGDGRLSAGPVDLVRYLAQPAITEEIRLALHKRRRRLEAAGTAPPADCHMLKYVVHVSPDQRKVYVGEEGDATAQGGSIMAFNKSWRSLPVPSWSGGHKMCDMPGAAPPKLVRARLSDLLMQEEPGLMRAAEALWALLAAHPATARAAARMAAKAGAGGASTGLGATAWNAYSLNIDFRTGKHVDGKNEPGSYSALVIFETGSVPVAGAHYLLPQYRAALDVRQGVVVFHRSGDVGVGVHANAALWRPRPDSHRVALVLYQTRLAALADGAAGGAGAGAAEGMLAD